MSASSKKQQSRERNAAKMTERQIAEQKEAKQLKLYTTAFVVVMALILVIAICVGVNQTVTNSGVREKNTTALTIGEHKISNAELNYFYIDSINNFYSQYGSYASLFGLDTTKPLNEQYVDEAETITWADDFLTSAKENAKSVYAMADAAEAAGFSLTEEEIASVESSIDSMDIYAAMYGYEDGDAYLKAMYGHGADKESYKTYALKSTLADAYYNEYANSLTYDDAALRAAEAENYNAYSSYSYNTYYIAASKFLTGGTADADGNTTYTEEETAASIAAAEAAAQAVTADTIATVEDFDAAIAALSINEGTEVSSTANRDTLYASLSSTYSDWLTDSTRKAGDKAYFANTSTTTAEDGTETTTVNGYYAVYFVGTNNNDFALKNVRHILVTPAHNHENGETHADGETYSDEELAVAKAQAEEILALFEADATEENFAALANERSADGDGTTGGLYENVYPGQMVTNFNDWCFDDTRVSGDTGIVETEYGYHVMYFVGDSDLTYRDYQISNELRSADVSDWYTSIVDGASVTEGETKYISMDLVLSAG